MDIVITGGQGVGKTTAAHKLIAAKIGTAFYKAGIRQLYVVPEIVGGRVDILRESIRMARAEVIYFDGCLLNATHLLIAIQAVKEAREQLGRDLYAVYVLHGDQGEFKLTQYPNNVDIKSYEL